MSNCSTIECLTVLLQSIDLFDALNDITQKKFGGALLPCLKIEDVGSNTLVAFLLPSYRSMHEAARYMHITTHT